MSKNFKNFFTTINYIFIKIICKFFVFSKNTATPEPFIDCVKTEIKDGQQIFAFRGKGLYDLDDDHVGLLNVKFINDILFWIYYYNWSI